MRMLRNLRVVAILHACVVFVAAGLVATAGEPASPAVDAAAANSSQAKTQRLLLIGQGPDGHAATTHEFMAAMSVLEKLLHDTPNLQIVVEKADDPWANGPELLDGADAVVLYVGQGAHWIQQDASRFAAFQRLAMRGGGLSALHWGMGTKDAKDIEGFVNLFGGCHGGPDRKYKVTKVRADVADGKHPILSGIAPFEVEDEFYYALKTPKPAARIQSLLLVPIDGENQTVSWAWERGDGGRSFGFSGCHFHRNWEIAEYRRLVAQGILWTLGRSIPESGVPVDVAADDLKLPPRQE